mgnify:CR=1 FL=1
MPNGQSLESRVGGLESEMRTAKASLKTIEDKDMTFNERIDGRLQRLEKLVYAHTIMLGLIGTIIYYFMDKLVKTFAGV